MTLYKAVWGRRNTAKQIDYNLCLAGAADQKATLMPADGQQKSGLTSGKWPRTEGKFKCGSVYGVYRAPPLMSPVRHAAPRGWQRREGKNQPGTCRGDTQEYVSFVAAMIT